MKRAVEIKPIPISRIVGIYSLQFVDSPQSEFVAFMSKYKDIADPIIKNDFDRIIKILKKIIDSGALERYFRTSESKIKDGVVAVPLDITKRKKGMGTLRLYCLRISDEVLIIGNGGIKKATYNENKELFRYVSDLAELDKVIKRLIRNGKLIIQGKNLILQDHLVIEI